MDLGRVSRALVFTLTVALSAACGNGSAQTVDQPQASSGLSSRSTAPLSSARATRYPANLALRPGATPVGDGPIGRAIAAFESCGSDQDCFVVLERVDGSQATLPADIADTPVSLSPDGTWLVYLRQGTTILRNLVTGVVQRLASYRDPLAWSPDSRWLMFGGRSGGDFIVRDVASGIEASHLHPSPPPGASAEPAEPQPSGPYYVAGVTEQGRVVRYERPDTPAQVGAFALDVLDPATMASHPIRVALGSPQGMRPGWQSPAPMLADMLYLQMSVNGTMTLLPVSLSTGTTGAAVTVTEPGSRHPVPFTATLDDQGWTTVAALPGQGLVYRVKAKDADGDDLIAVDPLTGRSRNLTHTRQGWPLALAAPPSR